MTVGLQDGFLSGDLLDPTNLVEKTSPGTNDSIFFRTSSTLNRLIPGNVPSALSWSSASLSQTSTSVASIIIFPSTTATEVIMVCTAMTQSAAGRPQVEFSSDNGATWATCSWFNANQLDTTYQNRSSVITPNLDTTSSTARRVYIHYYNMDGLYKPFYVWTTQNSDPAFKGQAYGIVETTSRINRVRFSLSGGNIRGDLLNVGVYTSLRGLQV